jgi:hypothetical protein
MQDPHWRCTPYCLGEYHDGFLTLFSQAVQKPGAGLFLTLFELLGWGFHSLDCSHWSVTLLYHSYWLDQLCMFFCVMGPKVFLVLVILVNCHNTPWVTDISFTEKYKHHRHARAAPTCRTKYPPKIPSWLPGAAWVLDGWIISPRQNGPLGTQRNHNYFKICHAPFHDVTLYIM